MLDESLIAYAVRNDGGLTELQRTGISQDDFVDEYRTVWRYLLRNKRDFDTVPGEDTLLARFPNLHLPKVRSREIPILVADVKKRTRYIRFLTALNDAAAGINSFEEIDEAVQSLSATLNSLTYEGGENSIVDLFSRDVAKRMVKEVRRRKRGEVVGIPTGLNRIDTIVGGLQKQKMITVIGRPGLGKSWLDLLFMAMAVQAGQKVILYPLEMTLFETATRLYSIFSQRMFGMNKALRNMDMNTGNIPELKLKKFLRTMEEKFEGKLLVADMSTMSDPYTLERIEAETEMYRPDVIWIDYITLLKPPGQNRGVDEWGSVKQLSTGIKGIATRRNVVGGVSAQVNRQALSNEKIFLPRLEHIAYGDSIGQDTDVCISINRAKGYLYYAVVKNRGGPEIGKTRCRFDVNIGHIVEDTSDEEED